MSYIRGPLCIPPHSGIRETNNKKKFYTHIPDDIWENMKNDFTQNNKIEIIKWFRDDSVTENDIIWDNEQILKFKEYYSPKNIIRKARNKLTLPTEYQEPYKEFGTYASVLFVYTLDKYRDKIKNKRVAIIGSITPWIEGICLNYNPSLIRTIEYNLPKIEVNSPVEVQTYKDFCKSSSKYDIIIQYSSIEHSGLGRYGDIIDPNADIKVMEEIYNHLDDTGLLLWGAPVNGIDFLGWNVHRVYGPLRLPLIFKNFEEIEWVPKSKKEIMSNKKHSLICNQPLIVLRKKHNN